MLTNRGRIWAWGWNKWGQLGVGDIKNRFAPTLVCSAGMQGKGVVSVASHAEMSTVRFLRKGTTDALTLAWLWPWFWPWSWPQPSPQPSP